ncbi:MAG: hypothetical protein ACLU5E_07385 [Anaerovoracaceae bacterium]
MELDLNRYIEVTPDSRRKCKTITVKENGDIKISKAMSDVIKTKKISMYISKNYKECVLDPNGDTLNIKANNIISAKDSVSKIDRRKIDFPMIYSMSFNEEIDMWIGSLKLPNNIISKTRKEMAEVAKMV